MDLAKWSAAWTLLRAPQRVSRPYHLQIVVTDRCNLACAGCLKSDPAHRPTNRNMPLADFERVLAKLKPRVVTLLGEGDPLLHPDLAAIVRAVRTCGARSHLATNLSVGGAATFDELLDAGLGGVRVTLSHSDRARYREIKGRDLFEQVLERLASLQAARKVRGAQHTSLMLEFWIDSDSLGEIPAHLRLALEHDVRSVQFLLHRPEEQRGALPLAAAQRTTLREAAELARRLGLRTNLATLGVDRSNSHAPGDAKCALPWLRAYVRLDGLAGPCVDWATKARLEPGMALDDVGSAAPTDCFSGPAFRSLRAAFRGGGAPHPICAGCTKGRVENLRNAARVRA